MEKTYCNGTDNGKNPTIVVNGQVIVPPGDFPSAKIWGAGIKWATDEIVQLECTCKRTAKRVFFVVKSSNDVINDLIKRNPYRGNMFEISRSAP